MKTNEYKVAILGAGIMGQAIIKRLIEKKIELQLYNRTMEQVIKYQSENTTICTSPKEAARNSDIIISFISDDEASRKVWFGPEGAVNGAKKGAVCLECSTLSYRYIKEWSDKLQEHYLHPIDCPVTGSKDGAETGTLTLFIGGKETHISQIRPFLELISTQIYNMGGVGNGCKFKLVYNMLSGTILGAFSEAVGLGKAFGLNLPQIISILSENGWSTLVGRGKGEQILLNHHQDVACKLKTLLKDMEYSLYESAILNQSCPIASTTVEMYGQAVENDFGDLDISAISKMYL